MIEKTVKLQLEEGLHARPATELTKICQSFKSKISIRKEELSIDPKSVLGIMTLGASKGDELTIVADGEDEATVIDKLVAFFEKK